jgi:hypothetical protein
MHRSGFTSGSESLGFFSQPSALEDTVPMIVKGYHQFTPLSTEKSHRGSTSFVDNPTVLNILMYSRHEDEGRRPIGQPVKLPKIPVAAGPRLAQSVCANDGADGDDRLYPGGRE